MNNNSRIHQLRKGCHFQGQMTPEEYIYSLLEGRSPKKELHFGTLHTVTLENGDVVSFYSMVLTLNDKGEVPISTTLLYRTPACWTKTGYTQEIVMMKDPETIGILDIVYDVKCAFTVNEELLNEETL